MKRIIFTIIFVLITVNSYAQIIVAGSSNKVKTFSVYVELYQRSNGTFYLSLMPNNRYAKNIIFDLGDKNKAIITLKSMKEYDKVSDNETIFFNNKTNNWGYLVNQLGAEVFIVHEEYGENIHGWITKSVISKIIREIEKY